MEEQLTLPTASCAPLSRGMSVLLYRITVGSAWAEAELGTLPRTRTHSGASAAEYFIIKVIFCCFFFRKPNSLIMDYALIFIIFKEWLKSRKYKMIWGGIFHQKNQESFKSYFNPILSPRGLGDNDFNSKATGCQKR